MVDPGLWGRGILWKPQGWSITELVPKGPLLVGNVERTQELAEDIRDGEIARSPGMQCRHDAQRGGRQRNVLKRDPHDERCREHTVSGR